MSSTTSPADLKATLHLGERSIDLPVMVGTENEHAVDISQLRAQTGYITMDDGYGNTGACKSAITYIDGDAGVLRYRGYPIEQLAERSTFVETSFLLIFGHLPTRAELAEFSHLLTENAVLHEQLRIAYQSFPISAHPMAILSSMINACSCYHPELHDDRFHDEQFKTMAAKLLSKVRTIAAFTYRHVTGRPVRYPDPKLDYCSNLLHMMFSMPYSSYETDPDVVKALNQILILHADHEQNCSTSTVRLVGSSGANLFSSCSAGVCALWGWRHGGANQAVLDMLTEIHQQKVDIKDYMERVKKKEVKLMGFGHRVYKNYDPRATILRKAADVVLPKLGVRDPLLDLARRVEEVALSDKYFIDRKLYPNVDFYSGILMRAIGIPVNMFTVMFSIGRMPGWIAQWKELRDQPDARIGRPRQVYVGAGLREYVGIDQRAG